MRPYEVCNNLTVGADSISARCIVFHIKSSERRADPWIITSAAAGKSPGPVILPVRPAAA